MKINAQGRGQRQRIAVAIAPIGFEHALSVDLAELVGASARGGMGATKGTGKGKGGGARHVALHGNLLAVATDHAMFLLHLNFDVKGEQARAGPGKRRLRVLKCVAVALPPPSLFSSLPPSLPPSVSGVPHKEGIWFRL